MIKSRAFMTLAALLGLSFSIPHPALAMDQATQMAHKEGDVGANTHDLVQGTHVEGHIAFLKTELAITPEQESLWEPVAAAMREDVATMQDADRKASQTRGPENAVAYLQNRITFANLRAQGEERFLNVFKPLYSALSSQQRQVADGLFVPDMPQ